MPKKSAEPYGEHVPDPYVPERNVEFPEGVDAANPEGQPENWERADKPEEVEPEWAEVPDQNAPEEPDDDE